MDGPFRRVAVVRLSSFGDVVSSLPAVGALRAALPDARLVWIVEDRCADLPRHVRGVDRVIALPLRAFGSAGTIRSRFEALRRLAAVRREIVAERFDLAVDLQGNLKSGVVTRATGAPVRVGLPRGDTKEPNWLFTNRRPPRDGVVRHRSDEALRLLTAIGLPASRVRPVIDLPESAVERVRVWALASRSTERRPLVVLHPGTSNFMPHKRWPPERYGVLARGLREALGARVVATFGRDDAEVVDAVLRSSDGAVERAPDLPSPLDLAAFLSRADLVVGGDTGPLHLADALGRPAVMIFGPTDPRLYHPLEHPERVLYERAHCSPCRFRLCPERICLDAVTPEQALAICLGVLKGPPAVV